MDERNDSRFDDMLGDIEFPGEDGKSIVRYLDHVGFTDGVMKKAEKSNHTKNRALVWGLVTFLDFIVLSIMGANGSFAREYLSIDSILNYFFFLFLGLAFLVGLCGLILNIDTSWMRGLDSRDMDGYFRNLPKRFISRFFK